MMAMRDQQLHYMSLSYVNVICHQRFGVEYTTKSTYRKKEELCSYEINKNLDIY